MMNNKIIKLLKGFGMVLLYIFLPSFLSIPILFVKSNIIKSLLLILVYIITCIIFIGLNYKDIKKDFLNYKKDFINIFKTSLKYWLIGFFIMLISSVIIANLGISNNLNQEQNIEMFNSYPLFEIITAIFLAPIIEEIAFRKSFNKAINNTHIFAIFTGTLFGLIHVISSLNNFETILYLIPYSALGIAFGYLYRKTNNILASTSVHMLHNAIAILDMLLIGSIML